LKIKGVPAVTDKTKRIAGIILLSVGIILSVVYVFFPVIFPITPLTFLLVGFIFLYIGFSSKNRGIMLLITGGIFIFLTTMIFIRLIPDMTILVTLSIVNIAFWFLSLIVPGIVKTIKKINFGEKTIYLYALAPLTDLWLLLYTIIIAELTAGASVTFIDFYFQYFFIALGGGIILSLIIIPIIYYY